MTHLYRARLVALFLSILCLLAVAPLSIAQTVAVADVNGVVTDQSGSAVPNAKVQMVELAKQLAHATVTDAAGRYTLPNLPVGQYKLEVQVSGFQTYVQTGIELQVANNVTLNVALKVGAVTETVEVSANAAMVETKENSIAQVVDERRIIELPLNGRNPTQLLTLTGGGTTAPGGDLTGSKNMQGSNGSGTFAVAGSQANGVTYLLDGGDNNDAFSNVNLPLPFPDAVQEFSVQTSAMPAQYGLHPGGVVNIVTRSGSNSFHGNVFDFLRNYKLNARQDATPARDSLKRNQFGGTAGGKIIRDKLFFFGGYQQTVQRSNPTATRAFVPTAAVLQGDFTTLESSACLKTPRTLKDPAANSSAPFVGNTIPKSRFDPASLKLVTNFIPTSTDACGLTFFGQPANNPDYQYIGKVDYVRSEKHSLFGRYYLYNYTAQTFFDGKNALTTGPTPGNRDRSQTVTIGDTYTFTPTRLNSFHATFDRRADNRGSAANLFSPNDLGVNMFDNVPNYIQLTISNYFNVGCGTCALGYFNVNTYQLSDDFTLIHGRHQFGFGIDFRKEQFNSTNNQQANGQFTFNGNTTGDALADLMIGRMSNFTDGNALSDYMRMNVFAAYAQDTFRLSPRLTLNFGIRWEPELPAHDKQSRGNQFSLPAYLAGYHTVDPRYPNAPAGLLFAVDPINKHGNQFTENHWLATSPRIGVVWDPTGSGKQTIRSAFALIHDSVELFYPERWTTNPPYASSVSLVNPTAPFSNPWQGYPGGNPFPGAAIFPASGVYVSIPPDVNATYMMQWNLSYERQLGANWLLSANYLGNRTNHILAAREINPAVFTGSTTTSTTGNTAARRFLTLLNAAQGVQYASIVQTDDGATAHYNGLLLSLNHRFSNHYTMLLNYTWSHCISSYDFGGELAGNNYQNPSNRAGEVGDCNFDRRQIFNATMVAISGGLGNGMVKFLTKDWSLAPIISAYSGQPFSPTDGGTDISLTAVGADRPNVLTTAGFYPNTQASWFNQAAFQKQAPGTFGNAGRDSIVGPGSFNWDLAVSREFHFKERYRYDLRADFFNILNHPNWNAPSGNITSQTFGQITSFSTPRIIQVSMKLFW
jgi:carboxypeptidase family protein/TonB-dependent receptor-like protein